MTREIDSVADELLEAYFDPEAKEMQHIGSYPLPNEAQVEHVLDECRALLFPGYAGGDVTGTRAAIRETLRQRVGELRVHLQRQIYRAHFHKQMQDERMRPGGTRDDSTACGASADEIADRFLSRMPALRQQVRLDLRAAYEGDPAASGVDEILACYPGMYAITVYRIAHALLREGAKVVPRMMTEVAHRRTGIDIHPGAEIGNSFFIDHGTGVVIGETTLIGERVRVYQGVTLGALVVPQGESRPSPGTRRHPTIEDEVVIYANATILGGETTIGRGSVIGGNAFVTTSVPAGSRVGSSSRASRTPGS